MGQWVYSFGDGKAEGASGDARICSAARAPISPRWPISACRCRRASPSPPKSARISTTNERNLSRRSEGAGRGRAGRVGNARPAATSAIRNNPLLVSVRSGARASMPGMMDTVLNLGLNDVTVEGLAKSAGDERFAYDSYRRFIQMYSDVVLEHRASSFRRHSRRLQRTTRAIELDTDLNAEDWQKLIADYKAKVERELGKPFPQDPHEQLWGAIGAVFGSWMNPRAITYRRLHDIPDELGHGRQCAGHGLRQYGRDLCHRRRLHAQSLDRREGTLRRISRQRARRRCRRRHPHAAEHHRSGAHECRLRQAVDGRGDAGGLRRIRCSPRTARSSITATCRTSNSPSSRASSGCCRRATASAPPRPR